MVLNFARRMKSGLHPSVFILNFTSHPIFIRNFQPVKRLFIAFERLFCIVFFFRPNPNIRAVPTTRYSFVLPKKKSSRRRDDRRFERQRFPDEIKNITTTCCSRQEDFTPKKMVIRRSFAARPSVAYPHVRRHGA